MRRGGSSRRRRGGQALVEFGLTLPILLALLLGSVEISRLLNIYVTLNRIARRAAIHLSEPDVTSSRSPLAGVRDLRRQLRDPSDPRQWNQAYSPLIVALQRAAPEESWLEIDVNYQRDDVLHSRVTLRASLPPLLVPTASFNGRTIGRVPVTGRGLAVNANQSLRRDGRGAYPSLRVPLRTILEHPDDPLPPLPEARR